VLELDQKTANILEMVPGARDFFAIKELPNDPGHRMASRISLRNMLQAKGINETAFLREFEEFVKSQNDILHEGAEPELCRIWGRIPCVVQLPIQNLLDEYISRYQRDLTYNIALVEFGREWIDDLTAQARPPVIMGAGIEGMVQNQAVMREYTAPPVEDINDDYKDFRDPQGIFHILTGVPLVFVADRTQLGEAEVPRTWKDLLDGDYSICYADDGHLLDGIYLVYIYQDFGEPGILEFKKRSLCGAHPSQMIKAGGIQGQPSVYVMPHIFASIKTKEPGFETIWPEDGAPLIPVVITQRKDASEADQRAASFLCGPECGNVFVTQGMFPASNPAVKNNLPGRLRWLGWDYIYQHNLLDIIPRIKTLFLG
jgi:ABC-type Fe3+ transport system substrate-binding protein